LPPARELRGLVGGFPSFVLVGPDVFALEVEGVCGSERGCEMPDAFEDCTRFGWSIEIDAGAGTGPAFGVEGTVDAYRVFDIKAWGLRLRARKRERTVRRQLEQIMVCE